jgi:hypothetical protein
MTETSIGIRDDRQSAISAKANLPGKSSAAAAAELPEASIGIPEDSVSSA